MTADFASRKIRYQAGARQHVIKQDTLAAGIENNLLAGLDVDGHDRQPYVAAIEAFEIYQLTERAAQWCEIVKTCLLGILSTTWEREPRRKDCRTSQQPGLYRACQVERSAPAGDWDIPWPVRQRCPTPILPKRRNPLFRLVAGNNRSIDRSDR